MPITRKEFERGKFFWWRGLLFWFTRLNLSKDQWFFLACPTMLTIFGAVYPFSLEIKLWLVSAGIFVGGGIFAGIILERMKTKIKEVKDA